MLLGACVLPLAMDGEGFSRGQKAGLWLFAALTFATGLGMLAPRRLAAVARFAAGIWALGIICFPLWIVYSFVVGINEITVPSLMTFAGSIGGVVYVGYPVAKYAMTGRWPRPPSERAE